MRFALPGLLSWLEEKATVVTASQLLASVATHQFTSAQLAAGQQSWQRPTVSSVDSWLSACWNEARYSGRAVPALLSSVQERYLWQTIIEQDGLELFDVKGSSRLAMQAARTVAEWQIPAFGEIWNESPDARHFLRWHELFRQRCREQRWVTRAGVWALLPGWFKQGACQTTVTVFAGFDPPPAAASLIQSLGLWGSVEPFPRPARRSSVQAAACKTFRDELELAARWARSAFEQNPAISIGVFIPQLPSHLAEVEQVFASVFYPDKGLLERGRRSREDCVFHAEALSFALPPVISNALLLLDLHHERIPSQNAAAILRSAYLAGAALERTPRAMADITLRSRRDIDVSLRDLEESSRECPLLVPIWRKVRAVRRTAAPTHDFATWSDYIRDLLEAVGWPGAPDELNSEERDAVEEWKNAVSRLATLSLVSAPVSFETVLSQLKSLLAGAAPPIGSWSSPVQILDASSADGLVFDRAFAAGLSEESWPPPASVSPLIPFGVQRAYGIPATSREAIFEQQQRLTAALLASAPAVAVTFSGRLSPLVEPFVDRARKECTPWTGRLPLDSYEQAVLGEVFDSQAPAYVGFEPTRGGTSLIRAQSQCPFRAFAEFRLSSVKPEDACLGFDSRDRGKFLHDALQNVWDLLKTQACLNSQTPEALKQIVREAVRGALYQRSSSPFYELATDAEWERLEKLLLRWLEIEKMREQPFTVETLESKLPYEIPGLRLTMRIDRMDRLLNGGVLLIDYKSGKQTDGKLKGKRPSEPQLLLYASALNEPVEGVFFGELTPLEARAVGFSRATQFAGQRKNRSFDWNSFLEDSKENVAALARGFVEGQAAVDPLKNACDYCSQKPFCRINEKGTDEGGGDTDE